MSLKSLKELALAISFKTVCDIDNIVFVNSKILERLTNIDLGSAMLSWRTQK
jgi:hypothetical protein